MLDLGGVAMLKIDSGDSTDLGGSITVCMSLMQVVVLCLR